MALTIGIVGLPNAGKSTLFNALTRNNVLAASYPFATIDPNIGVVGVPDPRLAVLAELLHSDRVRRVRVALEKLSGNQKTVIELAYFEGLSQAEMAERMGQPLGTVKTWVRTALKSLRDELGTAVPA